jgi:hypothetical protein
MTTNPRCRQFLDGFHAHATEAGLHPSEPKGTNNFVRFPAMGDSHIGVSVTSDRLRVNLNNDKDLDRSVFKILLAERDAFDLATGETLDWEDTDPARQKSVVRAARPGGYMSEAADWTAQYAWATGVVNAFEREYKARV